MVTENIAETDFDNREIDIFSLANISEDSQLVSTYLERLTALSSLALRSKPALSSEKFWRYIQDESESLIRVTSHLKVLGRGPNNNPLFKNIKNHELLAAILQPVLVGSNETYDGLLILLIESIARGTIQHSYRASTSDEMRKAVETGFSERAKVFRQLPQNYSDDFRQSLTNCVHKLASQTKHSKVEKSFIRALGRLTGIRVLNDEHRPKAAADPSIVRKNKRAPEFMQAAIKKIPSLDDIHIESPKIDIYEVVEPSTIGDDIDPPTRLFEQTVQVDSLETDAAATKESRESAYWLERATWVSETHSSQIIRPDSRRLCELIVQDLRDINSESFFISGLVACCYLTSTKPIQLLRDTRYRFSAADIFREIKLPSSSFTPESDCLDLWLEPVTNIRLKMPKELHIWLNRYSDSGGAVNIPESFKSERVLSDAYQTYLAKARDSGRFEITESKVSNAMRTELAKTRLGALAVFIIAGRENERAPVLQHYAGLSDAMLEEIFEQALEKLWIL